MIIGTLFDGDDDNQTKDVQKKVYGEALTIIVGGCREHVRAAEAILLTRNIWAEAFLTKSAFDHRTLQWAHDILAAAWRFRSGAIYPSFSFDGDGAHQAQTSEAWLGWLRSEVDRWPRFHPSLIRSVAAAVVNSNTERGEAAEDSLLLQLLDVYENVPWRKLLWRAVGRR